MGQPDRDTPLTRSHLFGWLFLFAKLDFNSGIDEASRRLDKPEGTAAVRSHSIFP
jgi:hypothetical protein